MFFLRHVSGYAVRPACEYLVVLGGTAVVMGLCVFLGGRLGADTGPCQVGVRGGSWGAFFGVNEQNEI